jgi:hypothetical protein
VKKEIINAYINHTPQRHALVKNGVLMIVLTSGGAYVLFRTWGLFRRQVVAAIPTSSVGSSCITTASPPGERCWGGCAMWTAACPPCTKSPPNECFTWSGAGELSFINSSLFSHHHHSLHTHQISSPPYILPLRLHKISSLE